MNSQGVGRAPASAGATYQVTRWIYNLFLWLLLPVAIVRLIWKSRLNPAYRTKMLQRFGFNLPLLQNCILVHAVSVGETVAAVPLIEALLDRFPNQNLLITSTTPTGYERASMLFGHRVEQCLLPFDTLLFTHRLIKQTKPSLVVIIETEIWPNLIYQCHRNHVPVLLANARLSERSLEGYQRIRWLIGPTLKKISCIATHAQPDAQRFIALGSEEYQTKSVGSIKFDLQLPPHLFNERDQLLRPYMAAPVKKPFIWVAASTHDGEETLILKVVQALKKKMPNTLCIIIPRHAERFEAVARLLEECDLSYARFSNARELPDVDILLGDVMGELLLFYAVADAAFVGGSLVPVGGHNVLESLACQTPTLVGPHMFNFQSIHEMLLENKAIIQVQDHHQLAEHLLRLAGNDILRDRLSQRGENVVSQNRGALDRLIAIAERLIEN